MIDRDKTDYEIQREIEVEFCKAHIDNARKRDLSIVANYLDGVLLALDEPEDEETENEASFLSVHQMMKDNWR